MNETKTITLELTKEDLITILDNVKCRQNPSLYNKVYDALFENFSEEI